MKQTKSIIKTNNLFLKNNGITLIALVITIVLNCYRSGQKLECAM